MRSRFHHRITSTMLIAMGMVLGSSESVQAQSHKLATAASATQKAEIGSPCSLHSPMTEPLLCVEETVIDCQKTEGSNERLQCASRDLKTADTTLNRLYQSALHRFERANNEYADYKSAKKALIESQRAWVKFKNSDCAVFGFLNPKGSTQAVEVVTCQLKHTKNRIVDFNAHNG